MNFKLFPFAFVLASQLTTNTIAFADTPPEQLTFKQFADSLPKSFKPKNKAPRGYSIWRFEPESRKEEQRLEIYNTSENKAFDAETKLILQPFLTKNTYVKPTNWQVRFDADGTIAPREKAVDVDYAQFMGALQRKIKSNWFPAKQTQNRRSKVFFTINYDGNLSGIRLMAMSGDEEFDKACLAAVVAAQKLSPLPEGAPDTVDIEFVLDYNIKSPPPVATKAPITSAQIDALWREAVSNQMQKVKEENKDLKPEIKPRGLSK